MIFNFDDLARAFGGQLDGMFDVDMIYTLENHWLNKQLIHFQSYLQNNILCRWYNLLQMKINQ